MADQNNFKGTLELRNQIGMTMNVDIVSLDDAYDTMRKFGVAGWSSGDIPQGGLVLPYCMAETFDWSLLGANHYTFEGKDVNGDPETKEAVSYRGHSYNRRNYEDELRGGVKYKKAVKYSRGAKASDPDDIKEGKGQTQYITLIIFAGNGRSIPMLEKKKA